MNLNRTIRRYAQASAEKYGVSVNDLLTMKRGRAILKARRETIRKVLRYTGYSQAQVALAWGIDPKTVRDAVVDAPTIRKFGVTEIVAAEDAVAEKLTWQYGTKRAATILAGCDPETLADIAKWNNLGRRAAA